MKLQSKYADLVLNLLVAVAISLVLLMILYFN